MPLSKLCCGCMACFNICHVNAIRIINDDRGFYRPEVGRNCINCGKCVKVCQIESKNFGAKPIKVYGGKNRDIKVRMESSSGGLFGAIIQAVGHLNQGRTFIWGAEWTDKMEVRHLCRQASDSCRFKGSKYVQSYVGLAFREIQKQLENGEYVIFSGTGCQCAGLRKYLSFCKTDTSKLLVVDIICHGVPSVGIWKDYLKQIEYVKKKKVCDYSFRDKHISWHGINPCITYEDGTIENPSDELAMSYGRLFGRLSLNSPCYVCSYASTQRVGDITLGDFWGIEKAYPDFEDERGVSVCLINTQKGMKVFESLDIEKIEVKDDSFIQPQLKNPVQNSMLRKFFWKDYLKKGYGYAALKYTTEDNFLGKIRTVLKKLRH